MTATVKPLPDHGTTARAHGRRHSGLEPCGCPRCRTAVNRYAKLRDYHQAAGRPRMIDAAEATAHLRMLLDAGHGWDNIAADAQITKEQIRRFLNGRYVRIQRTTAKRILAVQPKPHAKAIVDSIGTVRRLRALIAIGRTIREISLWSGIHHDLLGLLVNGSHPQVRHETAEAVAQAYRTWCMVRGSNARSRNRAVREGWAPPLAWGEDIDSPEAQPAEGWERSDRLEPTELVAEAEEIREMTGQDWGVIAARLGVRKDTLHQYRTRERRRQEASTS